MPKVQEIRGEKFKLLVWKIEEEEDFFLSKLDLSFNEELEFKSIKAKNRKLEWLATRYTQRMLVSDSIAKDDFGKPFLDNFKGHISFSHCQDFAAVIYGTNPVGIDIERLNPKIERIASKFLSVHELSFIDKQLYLKHLTMCWSIKESVYKYYGRKNLSFIDNIRIDSFQVSDSKVNVKLAAADYFEFLELSVESFDELILTYISC